MRTLDLSTARAKVLDDVRAYLAQLRRIAGASFSTLEEGMAMLSALRQAAYEDLNQIQHEHAALLAAGWLVAHRAIPEGAEWLWNPRQTGTALEPDIRCVIDGQIVLSAEVTTSLNPVGAIDKRMSTTLGKLANMVGERFYFVASHEMERRALIKVGKARLPITVVRLDMPRAEAELAAKP